MKKIIFTFALSVITLVSMAQASEELDTNPGKKIRLDAAIGVSASTNGLGANVVASFNNIVALRLGYESINKSFPNAMTISQDDYTFDVSPSLKNGGFSAILDWYIRRSFYISAGMVVSNLNMTANIKSANAIKIGDIEYSPDEMGEMTLAIQPQNKVSPYFGIGFGRNIGRSKNLAMSFEIGAYDMGAYVVDVTGTKLFEANGDPASQTSIAKLNETLKGLSWSGIYPIIKIGISYKIWKN